MKALFALFILAASISTSAIAESRTVVADQGTICGPCGYDCECNH